MKKHFVTFNKKEIESVITRLTVSILYADDDLVICLKHLQRCLSKLCRNAEEKEKAYLNNETRGKMGDFGKFEYPVFEMDSAVLSLDMWALKSKEGRDIEMQLKIGNILSYLEYYICYILRLDDIRWLETIRCSLTDDQWVITKKYLIKAYEDIDTMIHFVDIGDFKKAELYYDYCNADIDTAADGAGYNLLTRTTKE